MTSTGNMNDIAAAIREFHNGTTQEKQMPKPTMTHAQLRCVAESFRDELARLHKQMDWSTWKNSELRLQVYFSTDKVKWLIRCYADGHSVEGSDLGVVMDEVYRRLGYEHREEARIESSMVALPSPDKSCNCPAKYGEDCPLTAEECAARQVHQ